MTDLSEEQKRNLENDWGPAAPYSDYKRGEAIRYRSIDGTIESGEIIWVAAPGPSAREGHDDLPTRYIVARAGWSEDSFPDVVYSSDILQSTDEELTLEPCNTNLRSNVRYFDDRKGRRSQ